MTSAIAPIIAPIARQPPLQPIPSLTFPSRDAAMIAMMPSAAGQTNEEPPDD